MACRSLAEVKSSGLPESVADECQACLVHPCPNKALAGLASVASAGAVWLLKPP